MLVIEKREQVENELKNRKGWDEWLDLQPPHLYNRDHARAIRKRIDPAEIGAAGLNSAAVNAMSISVGQMVSYDMVDLSCAADMKKVGGSFKLNRSARIQQNQQFTANDGIGQGHAGKVVF